MTAPVRLQRERRSIRRSTPDEKYRRVAAGLAHLPTSDGMPDAPFLAARVTFSDVADALGITRPALYRLWPSQYDFWIDLTRYIAYEIDYSQLDHEMPWAVRHGGVPATLPRLAVDEIDTVMSTHASAVQDIVFADVRVLIRAASLGYPDVEDLGDIRQHVEARRIGLLGVDVAGSLMSLGRTAARDTEFEIAGSMWCLADGLSILHRLLPEQCARRMIVDFGHGPDTWTLLALASRAIYFGLSAAVNSVDESQPRPPLRDIPAPERVWTHSQVEALDTASQLFVDSITDLASVDDGPNVLGYVTIARVASLARVSRRTIYNVWSTRRALLADVLDDVLAEGYRRHRDVLDAAKECGVGALTNALVGPAGQAAPIDPSLAFLIELNDERTRTPLARAQSRLIADLAERLDDSLRTTRRRPIPGVTTNDLALLWSGLVQGGRRLRRANPTTTVELGAAIEAIVRELTVDD